MVGGAHGVSELGDTDGAVDRALRWPEQEERKALALLTVAPSPCVSCTGTRGHLGGGPRSPLALTTHPSPHTPPARKGRPLQGKMPKAEGPGRPLPLGFSQGQPLPCPWATGARLSPSPSLLQLPLQRSGFRWGLFGSVFVWGGRVIAVLMMSLLLPNSHVLTVFG